MTRGLARVARLLLAWAVLTFAFGTFMPADPRADEIVLVAAEMRASASRAPRPSSLGVAVASAPSARDARPPTAAPTPDCASFVFVRDIYLRNRSLLR